jgi:hypothetical protein
VNTILIVIAIGALLYFAVGGEATHAVRPRVRNLRAKYGKYVTRPVLTPLLIYGVLGLLMRDVVLTLGLIGVAMWLAWRKIKRIQAEEGLITARSVLQLVLSFRAAYQLEPAAFKSLEEAAKKLQDPLRTIVQKAVETYFMTSSSARGFADFRSRTDNVLLSQFIYILEMSESASNTSVTASLDAFVQRLRGHDELQRQVETSLSGITSQTGFMQTLAIIIAYLVAVVPGLHDVYTTLFGRLAYIVLMGVIIGATIYIDREVIHLKEQIL